MLYSRWTFLFSFFIFFNFSVAVENSENCEPLERTEQISSQTLKDSDPEKEAALFQSILEGKNKGGFDGDFVIEIDKFFGLSPMEADWLFYFQRSFPGVRVSLEISDFYSGIVRLLAEDGSGAGTGFFIKPDRLTTANHVADRGPLHFLDPSTGERVVTEVLGVNDKHDLALLKTIGYESECFYSVGSLDDEVEKDTRIAARESLGLPYQLGDSIIIAGFPQGSFNVVKGTRTGRIVNTRFHMVEIVYKAYEVSSFSGISGGPAFSLDKHLIGVVARGTDDIGYPAEIGFVSVGHLRNLVREVDNGKILSPSLR